MRLPGWCSECKKVRQVTASGQNAMLAAMRGGVTIGVCDSCQAAADRAVRQERDALVARRRAAQQRRAE